MDGAGFAFRGDHKIASIRMQANWNYSTEISLHRTDIGPLEPRQMPPCTSTIRGLDEARLQP